MDTELPSFEPEDGRIAGVYLGWCEVRKSNRGGLREADHLAEDVDEAAYL